MIHAKKYLFKDYLNQDAYWIMLITLKDIYVWFCKEHAPREILELVQFNLKNKERKLIVNMDMSHCA